jgi:glucose-1-phosphate thymidylyltransferase
VIAILLAAGYGTRLSALGLDKPKALLEFGGETLLGRLCRDIETIPSIEKTIVVSNELYYPQLLHWVTNSKNSANTIVVSDGTYDPAFRLGAVGDIAFAVQQESIREEVLVVATDCYLTFPFQAFCDFFESRRTSCVVVEMEKDRHALHDGACAIVDAVGRITFLQEKPVNPRSNLGVCPVYIYTREDVELLGEFLTESADVDSPGRFLEWLYSRRTVYAYQLPDTWRCLDAGTPSGYAQVASFADPGDSDC